MATTSIAPSFDGKKKKKTNKSLLSSAAPSVASTRPTRKSKQKKSYQELSSNESEEEEDKEEEEEEKPKPKRGRFVTSSSSRQSHRPRPSNISTISELTQESYGDGDDLDAMEKEDIEEEASASLPKKKARHTLSISSPIHQVREEEDEAEAVVEDKEEEGVDDSHWGNPSRDMNHMAQVDPVLGLHLEDFGTGTVLVPCSFFHLTIPCR
jgi:hypothetical protein